jgi:hypothetical protein
MTEKSFEQRLAEYEQVLCPGCKDESVFQRHHLTRKVHRLRVDTGVRF